MQAQRGSTGTLSLAWFLDRGEWSTPPLAALPLAKKTVTPYTGGLVDLSTGWTHAENIPTHQPQTVQSVVNGYTN